MKGTDLDFKYVHRKLCRSYFRKTMKVSASFEGYFLTSPDFNLITQNHTQSQPSFEKQEMHMVVSFQAKTAYFHKTISLETWEVRTHFKLVSHHSSVYVPRVLKGFLSQIEGLFTN